MSDRQYTNHEAPADVELSDTPGSKLERLEDRPPLRGRLIVGDRSFQIRGQSTDIVQNAVEAIAEREGIDLDEVDYTIELYA